MNDRSIKMVQYMIKYKSLAVSAVLLLFTAMNIAAQRDCYDEQHYREEDH